MKNIFARGGIEFLAVMLGISVSLWVDERRIEANSQEDFQADLFAIHNELKDDLITINSAMDFNNDMLNKFRHLLSVMEKDKIDLSALDTIPLFNSYPENRSFFGKKSAYLASKSSGHLNRNSHLMIVQELTKLYDQIYSRMEANNEFMDKIAAEADRVLKKESWLAIFDFWLPYTSENNYHHLKGIKSYKMDTTKMFSWHPAYTIFDHSIRHHKSNQHTDNSEEWVASTLIRKKCIF